MLGISRSRRSHRSARRDSFHCRLGCFRNDVQLKTHQLLVFTVAEHERYERHVERALLALNAYLGSHHGHGRQRIRRDCLVAPHVGFGHVYKFGVFYCYVINRISVVAAYLMRISKARQERIDLDLLGSQVEETLRGGMARTPHKSGKQQETESIHHIIYN